MDITFEIWTKVTSTILFRYFAFASISFVLFYVILKKPLWIDLIDKSLNPIMGKSTAMYFTKK